MRSADAPAGSPEASLVPLFVPVPQNLSELLGYPGTSRYVAFFWSDEANEAVVTDGCVRAVGESVRFLEYVGHRNVECELGDIDIGLFGRPATTWLVVDRHSRNLYYTSSHAAPHLLAEQQSAARIQTLRGELSSLCGDVLDDEDPELDRLLDDLDYFPKANDHPGDSAAD